MKLVTFNAPEAVEHIGAILPGEGVVVDFTAEGGDARLRSMLDLIDAGPDGLRAAEAALARRRHVRPIEGVTLLAPLPRPRRLRDFLCFEQHFRQARANRHLFGIGSQPQDPALVEVPRVWYERPIYYKGNPFSVVGPEADIHWPRYSTVIDYELEIGIVTARRGKQIPRAEAAGYVFGYTIFNDFSARDAQLVEMQGGLGPAKGKDFDTGNAMGPWLVTADEVPDPQALSMVTRVNGEEWSRGSSGAMHHGCLDIVSYASDEETLYPGEILGSGTVGSGCGLELGRFLKDGDVLEVEVGGLGLLRNRIVAPHVPQPPAFPIQLPI